MERIVIQVKEQEKMQTLIDFLGARSGRRGTGRAA